MIAKWKMGYLKAVLRQDVGWYDVSQPQRLASVMSAHLQNIEQAYHSQ